MHTTLMLLHWSLHSSLAGCSLASSIQSRTHSPSVSHRVMHLPPLHSSQPSHGAGSGGLAPHAMHVALIVSQTAPSAQPPKTEQLAAHAVPLESQA